MGRLDGRLKKLEKVTVNPLMPLVAWQEDDGRFKVDSAYYGLNTVMTEKELDQYAKEIRAGTEIPVIKVVWA